MHAADLMTSQRLQRVYRVLSDGQEHSTRDLVFAADVCAVSTIVEELRQNDCIINCQQTMTSSGRIWLYKMIKGNSDYERPQLNFEGAGNAAAG